MEIDNPERLELQNPANGANVINDVSFFRLWMPPDNKAYQVDLTGGITLPARHKVTGSLSTGNMTMDMGLLPISTNPNLATSATDPNPAFTIIPPYGDIAAQFDTFMGQLKLTGDPLPWFGYILSWRKFDLEDKTEEYHFNSSVRGDVRASYSSSGFTREHQGWGSDSLRAEVHFRPTDRPAPGCAVRRGEAPLRLPFVRRREGRRVHPLRRLHPRLGDPARSLDQLRSQAG